MSSEEAKEVLLNQPVGTYLIRFSSKGCFAASFVSTAGVKHVLIMNEGTKNYSVNTGDGQEHILNFISLEDLIAYYQSKGVFTSPYVSNRRIKFSTA